MSSRSRGAVRTTPKKASWNGSFSRASTLSRVQSTTRNSNSHLNPTAKTTSRSTSRSTATGTTTTTTAASASPDEIGSEAAVPQPTVTKLPVPATDNQQSMERTRTNKDMRKSVPAATTIRTVTARRSMASSSTVASHGLLDNKTTTTAARGTTRAPAVPAPSRGFRELQRSEQHLQEENDRLAAAASKSALKIRSLKQDRDELKGTVEILQSELDESNISHDSELEHIKSDFAAQSEVKAEELRQLRQTHDDRERALETQLEAARGRIEKLEKFVESLGINAVSFESFAASDKENTAVVDLERNLCNISSNLENRAPMMRTHLAQAKELLGRG